MYKIDQLCAAYTFGAMHTLLTGHMSTSGTEIADFIQQYVRQQETATKGQLIQSLMDVAVGLH